MNSLWISGNIAHKLREVSKLLTALIMKSRIFQGTEVLPSSGWNSKLEDGNSAFLGKVSKFLPECPWSYSRVHTFVNQPFSRKRNKIVVSKIHTFYK
jgi:hypothetical protein